MNFQEGMMGKKSWLIGFLVLALGLTGGCGQGSKKGITLRCIGWGDVEEEKILEAAVREFNQAHPDVEVTMERAPYNDYITKVLTEFAGGLAPDVMAVNAEQMVAFSSRGILVDLKPYADKDTNLKLADFYPEAVDHYTVNGQLEALPRDIAPVAVIYYNKKKFDEAHLPYPKNGWDQTQFLATAKKLTQTGADGRTTQFGFVDDWSIWDAWVYSNGGSLVDNEKKPTRCTLDSAAAISGVQFRSDLINKYHVMPSPANMTAMGGLGNSDLFMNGTVAMLYSGIWKTPVLRQIKDFDWDIVEFPVGPKGHRGFPMSAAGYAVVKTCQHPDIAYELVKFLAGEVGQKYMAATGLTQPAMKSLAKSPVFLDGQKPVSKAFLVDAVKDGHFQPYDPNLLEWINMVGSALDRVWNGDDTAEKALTKITKEINGKFYKNN
jgi:multiple sugar transport system substrate-binding protein